MTIDVATLAAALVFAWFSGYGSGLAYRHVRQIFEKVTR
jgi:nitrate/nitrite transporter NarK